MKVNAPSIRALAGRFAGALGRVIRRTGSEAHPGERCLIPATMATQHPDNALAPRWSRSAFVSTADEVGECRRNFNLGCGEQMWDAEGKWVEASVERLLAHDPDFFRQQQLGRDLFLTVRLPNLHQEPSYRLRRILFEMMAASHVARQQGVHSPPIIDLIVPMTTSPDEPLQVLRILLGMLRCEERLFGEVVARHQSFGIIPLFEGAEILFRSGDILEQYATRYRREAGSSLRMMRPFIARSDPALDAGFVPAVLSGRAAISESYRFQERTGIQVYPILGVGSLLFRGGLSPVNLDRFLVNYAGARTVTIQSAFRYDYPHDQVMAAIQRLNRELPLLNPTRFSPGEVGEMSELSRIFTERYRAIIRDLAEDLSQMARHIPRRRERRSHTGPSGYGRTMEGTKVQLPRAIGFTASFFSFGVPPSLIATGHGIREVLRRGKAASLDRFLPTLREDLLAEGAYLNKENLERLARRGEGWKAVAEDVRFLEDYLGVHFEPRTTAELNHARQTSILYALWERGQTEPLREAIVHAAEIRRSLG